MTVTSTELARLADAATPGEWVTAPDHMSGQDYETCIELTDRVGHIGTAIAYFHHDWETDRISWKAAQSNTALCVTLRNNLPAIIAALRAQQHADALADGMGRAITFIEALADNDLDEPIADNGVTVGAKLQMDAPPLIFKLRAALAAYRSVK